MLQSTIAWKNGQWLPIHQVHLSLDDWGVLQGAMIVDRLRTINAMPLDVELHVARLKSNCAYVGIPSEELGSIANTIHECAKHNHSRVPDRDFSIVVLVTPGSAAQVGSPTVIVYVQPLKRDAILHWYSHGQQLFVAEHRNVPAACWSPNLKSRARLHYYLADREAEEQSPIQTSLHSAAVLLDTEGNITETSAANVLCVDREGTLHCPPLDNILNGISLQRTLRLANSLSINVNHRLLPVDFVEASREVILTGTSACIWPASQFGRTVFHNATEQPVYQRLLAAWIEDVQFDFRKFDFHKFESTGS